MAAASLAPQPSADRQLEIPLASVPAGSSQDVCPGPAKIARRDAGGDGPAVQPRIGHGQELGVGGSGQRGRRVAAGQQAVRTGRLRAVRIAKVPAAATAPAGASGQLAGIIAQRSVKDVSVLSADALGNRQPAAAAVMSYTATDGDLQGSAAPPARRPQ